MKREHPLPPHRVVEDYVFKGPGRSLTTSAKFLAFTIAYHINRRTRTAFPSDEKLASESGLNVRTVREQVGGLQALFEIHRGGPVGDGRGYRSTTYRLRDEPGGLGASDPEGLRVSDPEGSGSQAQTLRVSGTAASGSQTPLTKERMTKERMTKERRESSDARALTLNSTATDSTEKNLLRIADLYIRGINTVYPGRKRRVRPRLLVAIREVLDQRVDGAPAYSENEIVMAGLLAWTDPNDWYASQAVEMPLRFKGPGRNHLDPLIEQIEPGATFALRIMEAVKAVGLTDWLKARTARPTAPQNWDAIAS